MRRASMLVCLFALAVPLVARASSMDLITLTGPSGTFTLTVPSAPTPILSTTDPNEFFLNNVPVNGPGYSSTGDTVIFSAGTANSDESVFTLDGGGVADLSVPGFLLNVYGSQMFGGTVSAPTFSPSSGTEYLFLSPTNIQTERYTITAITAPTPTPEPNPALLMATGLAMLAGAGLYRRHAAPVFPSA